jgi:hypothetical protein
MSCKVCGSNNQSIIPAEIALHVSGLNTPHVFVFPNVIACLNCGVTECLLFETERKLLIERGAAPNSDSEGEA